MKKRKFTLMAASAVCASLLIPSTGMLTFAGEIQMPPVQMSSVESPSAMLIENVIPSSLVPLGLAVPEGQEIAKAAVATISDTPTPLNEAPTEEGRWEAMEVPSGCTSFKAQESFKVLTNPSTRQYQMQHDGKAWTDEAGFRRYGEDGHYMVAMGSYYNPVCGTVLRVTLESGKVFTVITGDQKANVHTDSRNQYCLRNGSVLEFIVDLSKINSTSRRRGDMSWSSGMEGNITKIERLVE